ncbi:gliding motility-associated-like protein/uncharacterized repeat protein (TIGR01451 family) [Chitinophaga sp. OAE865]
MLKSIQLLILSVVLVFLSLGVNAEGSKDLVSRGGTRAFLASGPTLDTKSYPFRYSGTVKVYAKAGEKIYMGSSAQGLGNGTIVWRAPDGSTGNSGTGSKSIIGRIENRTQEMNGPNNQTNGPDKTKYNPYIVTVNSEQEGIWEIDFISPMIGSSPGASNLGTISADKEWKWNTDQDTRSPYIAAFDVTVRDVSDSRFLTGRVYLNLFCGYTGNGGFNALFYVLTKDGYQYTVDANGFMGKGFVFFVNNKGFINSKTGAPSYLSVTDIRALNVHDPTKPDDATNTTHKLFLNAPAADLPALAKTPDGFQTWMLVKPMAPKAADFKFEGVEGTKGSAGTWPLTSFIKFVANISGSYEIAIDIDKNGIYTDKIDRKLKGSAIEGENSISWDGLDGLGKPVAPTVVASPGVVKITLFGGEVHFPLIDVENNPNGIKITRINGDKSPESTIYWDDSPINSEGSSIPSSPQINTEGVNSLEDGHKWGRPTFEDRGFGNEKGLDSWTYVFGDPLISKVPMILQQADLEIVSIEPSAKKVCVGTPITFKVVVRNNGPSNTRGAKLKISIPTEFEVDPSTLPKPGDNSAIFDINLNSTEFTASLNMANQDVFSFTISGKVKEGPSNGSLPLKASILRPADVNDPDATNSDPVAPTDPEAECKGLKCNNIKETTVSVDSKRVTASIETPIQSNGNLGVFMLKANDPGPGIGKWILPDGSNAVIKDLLSPNTSINLQPNTNVVVVWSVTNGSCMAKDSITLKYDVVMARLGVVKTASLEKATAGSALNYTIRVTNHGPGNISAKETFKVVETLPAGYIVESYKVDQGSYDLKTGDWTGADLPAGATVTLTLNGKVDAAYSGMELINKVNVIPPPGILPPPADPGKVSPPTGSEVKVPVTRVAALGIVKTASLEKATAGSPLNYIIKVTNHGPGNISAKETFKVVETLPAGYIVESYKADRGSYDLKTGDWTGADLPAGATVTLTLNGKVDAAYSGMELINKVNVIPPPGILPPPADPDKVSPPTSSEVKVPVTRVAALGIVKTASQEKATAGSPLNYTIRVTNHGPGNISAKETFKVVETLPAGYIVESYKADRGSYDLKTGDWTGADLPAGATVTLTLNGKVDAAYSGMELINKVSVIPPPGILPPPADPGKVSPPTSSEVKVPVTRVAALGIVKTASQEKATAGSALNYTIRVTNHGPGNISAKETFKVVETLPAGYIVESYKADRGSYDLKTGDWTGADLPAGATVTLTLNGKVDAAYSGMELINKVSVIPPPGILPPPADPGKVSPPTSSEVKVPVTRVAALGIVKTASQEKATAGSALNYTIRVTNHGPGNISAKETFKVVETLPAGYIVESYKADQGSYDLKTGEWTGADLPAGATVTLTLNGKVDAAYSGMELINKVSVIPPPGILPPPADPDKVSPPTSSEVKVPVTRVAALGIVKTASMEKATAGSPLNYTIRVTNHGPGNISAKETFKVVETLPAGYIVESYKADRGSYNLKTGDWTGADLPAGTTVTLTLNGKVDAAYSGMELINKVSVIPPPGIMPPPADPDKVSPPTSSEVKVPVTRVAALGIVKTASTEKATAGSPLNYIIKVTNHGPGNISAKETFKVVETLPAGYIVESYKADRGSYDLKTGDWTGADLPAGATVTLTLNGKVDAAYSGMELINKVNVIPPPGILPPPADPGKVSPPTGSEVKVPVTRVAALGIVKTASMEKATAGSPLNYIIKVTNHGPGNISAKETFKVVETLPAGYIVESYKADRGSYDLKTGDWTGADLPAGATVTLTLNGKVDAAYSGMELINKVSVIPPPGILPPPADPGKVSPPTSSEVKVPVTRVAALGIVKTASQEKATAGSPLNYVIKVTNYGPGNISAKETFKVVETLPAGYIVESYKADRGSYDLKTGDWTGADLPAGATVTLTLNGKVDAAYSGMELINKVNVIPPPGILPPPADPGKVSPPTGSEVKVPVTRVAALGIVKTASMEKATAGSPLNYIIKVTNHGPGNISAKETFKVVETLPAGYIVESYKADRGSYDLKTGDWTGADLPAGATVTLTLNGKVDAAYSGMELINKVNVIPPPGILPPPADPGKVSPPTSSEVKVPVTRVAALGIVKTASQKKATAGSALNYIIKVTNHGPGNISAKETFKVVETLPAGYIVESYKADQGSYDLKTGDWTGADLPAGATVTLTLNGKVDAAYSGMEMINKVSVIPPPGILPPPADPGKVSPPTGSEVKVPVTRVAALGIVKTASQDTAIAGNPLNYTIRVTNYGPANITSKDVFKVTESIPMGFVVERYKVDQGNYNISNGSWTNAFLPAGATVTLMITGKVAAEYKETNLTNKATVTLPLNIASPPPPGPGQPPLPPTISEVTVPVVRTAALSVTKTASEETAIAGKPLNYTIKVTNNGPANIEPTEIFEVIESLPAGYILESYKVDQGQYDINTGSWTNVYFTPGTTITLTIIGRMDADFTGKNVVNKVSVKLPPGMVPPDQLRFRVPEQTVAVSTVPFVEYKFFIPNVFTPNGDGKNDKFTIVGIDRYPGSGLIIYNRWGNEVYNSKSYNNEWDGRGLNEGTYYYLLQLKTPDGIKPYKGWIELLR